MNISRPKLARIIRTMSAAIVQDIVFRTALVSVRLLAENRFAQTRRRFIGCDSEWRDRPSIVAHFIV
jgi:hypothetical protein